jgi:hypothetical protein
MTDHPHYERLLALMDDEDAAGAGAHVRACAACRETIDECRAAVADYALYEELFVLPATAPPSRDWLDLRVAMREVDTSVTAGIASRLISKLAANAGRIAGTGAALGCLAFALVLVTRPEKHAIEAPPPTAPVVVSPKSISRGTAPSPTRRPVDAGPRAVESPLNTEVRVFAALHRLGADLGEPVEVARGADGKTVVSGAGVAPARQAEIREALAAEPEVSIRFSDPAGAPGAAPTGAQVESRRSPLEARVRSFAVSQEAYENFSDRALDESEELLARAHALRILAERFPAARRADLRDPERDLLDSMIAAHRAAFRLHARALLRLIEPLAAALDAPRLAAAAADPLDAAQRIDRVLSAIFGAARTELTPEQLIAELASASATLSATIGGRQ